MKHFPTDDRPPVGTVFGFDRSPLRWKIVAHVGAHGFVEQYIGSVRTGRLEARPDALVYTPHTEQVERAWSEWLDCTDDLLGPGGDPNMGA
jgi:hypothetical protein